MPRSRFTPDLHQRTTLRALEKLAERQARDDALLTQLIAKAKEQEVPIEQIARSASVTPKTVYRRLGHKMR